MKSMVIGFVAAAVLAVGVVGGVKAGSAGGATAKVTVVAGGTSDVYTVTFIGGQRAEVAIVGDGDTDLDLYVYDENGNLIASSDGPSDREAVSWTPRWTGKFKIKVVNRSRLMANRYAIACN